MKKQMRINPSWLQAGDHVLSGNHDVMIKFIDGPDHAGVYDIFGVNEKGDAEKITAQEFVTLLK